MSLVERINKLAKSRSIPISQIERELNFGNGTIRKWDNNSPSCQKVFDLANLLNVDIHYLLTGEHPIPNLPAEYEEIINIYKKLTPKQQTIIKGKLYEYQETVEQKSPEEVMQAIKKERNFEIAKKMLTNNVKVADVIVYTDLDELTVKNLTEELKN